MIARVLRMKPVDHQVTLTLRSGVAQASRGGKGGVMWKRVVKSPGV